jgi:hypothetical protein
MCLKLYSYSGPSHCQLQKKKKKKKEEEEEEMKKENKSN